MATLRNLDKMTLSPPLPPIQLEIGKSWPHEFFNGPTNFLSLSFSANQFDTQHGQVRKTKPKSAHAIVYASGSKSVRATYQIPNQFRHLLFFETYKLVRILHVNGHWNVPIVCFEGMWSMQNLNNWEIMCVTYDERISWCLLISP